MQPWRSVHTRSRPRSGNRSTRAICIPRYQVAPCPDRTWSENRDQQNLRAVFVAQSDPQSYGQLRILTAPTDRQVSGPALVGRSMSSNAEISAQESLLGTGGSQVRYGNMQVLPVNGSLLFVRPMFVEASNSNLPSLRFVAVSYRDKIGFDPTIEGALAKVGLDPQTGELTAAVGTGASKPKPSGSSGAGGSTTDSAVLSDVADLLNDAQTALDSGDLGTYQTRVDDARKLLEERAAATPAPTTVAPTPNTSNPSAPEPTIVPPSATLPFPGDSSSGEIKPKLLTGVSSTTTTTTTTVEP